MTASIKIKVGDILKEKILDCVLLNCFLEEPALTSIHVRADQLTSLSSSGMVARGALGRWVCLVTPRPSTIEITWCYSPSPFRLLSPRSVSDGMHSQLVKSYFGCVFVLSPLAASEAWTELTRLLRWGWESSVILHTKPLI